MSQIVLSQDTVYLSNLGEASGGGVAVNNDSVIRAPFTTGSNSGGYILDSVQLVMNAASGDPTDFNVAIYGLGSLTGSANPFNAGVFTYIASGITLQADTTYYVAVISRQSSINGDYYWSLANTSDYDSSDNWAMAQTSSTYYYTVNGGIVPSNPLQFAIDATVVPEPSVFGLLALGSLLFGFRRSN